MMGWGKDWQRTTRLITDGKDKDGLRTYLARDGQVGPGEAMNVERHWSGLTPPSFD